MSALSTSTAPAATAATTSAPKVRLGTRLRSLVEQTWLIGVLGVLWWIVSARLSSPMVPSLQQILQALWTRLGSGAMLSDLAYSLVNLVVALALATVVGVGLGVLLGRSRTAYLVLDPLLQYLRSIPKVALVPLFVVFLGIGREPKIIVIALACLWPILLNTADGVRSIHPAMLDVGRAYRFSRTVTMRRLVLPAIAPQVFAGIRVALGLGTILLVVSEMYGAIQGIGFQILQSSRSFELPETWAGTLVLGIVGYALSLIFEFIEKRVLTWHFSANGKS